eukprot:6293928-Pyramimonas_sp.AAC.1
MRQRETLRRLRSWFRGVGSSGPGKDIAVLIYDVFIGDLHSSDDDNECDDIFTGGYTLSNPQHALRTCNILVSCSAGQLEINAFWQYAEEKSIIPKVASGGGFSGQQRYRYHFHRRRRPRYPACCSLIC